MSVRGNRGSVLVEHQTCDRKVASLNPGRSGGRIFFSTVNLVCGLLFGICFHPCVTVVACKKKTWSFCQKCRWQVNTIHPWPNKVGVGWLSHQAKCGILSRNEFICTLSGNNQPQSSQLAKPLWTDPGLKSGISVCKLISKKKEKKKTGGE